MKVRTFSQIKEREAVKPHFGNGIALAGGFDLGAQSALDSRSVAKTIAHRDEHVTSNRAYEGMLVYVEETGKTYQYVKNNDGSALEWQEFGFNNDKFQEGISDVVSKVEDHGSRLDVVEGKLPTIEQGIEDLESDLAQETTNREQAIAGLQAKLDQETARAKAKEQELNTKIDTEKSRAEGVEAEIKQSVEDLRGLITNHSKTIVVQTIADITKSNTNPVVGDLAYVIDIKRSYIYKGEEAAAAFDLPTPPEGWVLFDELSNVEVDLADYLKKADADAKYRLKTAKVAEAELEDALKNKINAKADASSVYTKDEVDGKVKTTDDKVVALTPRVDALEEAMDQVPEQISSAVQASETKLNAAINAVSTRVTEVDNKVTANTQSITSLRSEVEVNSNAITAIESSLDQIEAAKTKVVSTLLKGNQAITLEKAPVEGSKVELYVNGIKYNTFTAADVQDVYTITWNGAFTLDAEDDIEVISTVLESATL